MKKPREFWLLAGDIYHYVGNPEKLDLSECVEQIHVREVIELTDAEIVEEANCSPDFIAGARWAIAKLTGGSK